MSQACQAGLETGTHPGEAVPCRCCICKVCKPRRRLMSGRSGDSDEYALAKAAISHLEANHVLTAGCGGSRGDASRKHSIGLCYTVRLGGCFLLRPEARRHPVPA